MLNSQNSNFANSGNQTHNSRKSNSRKEKAQIGAKITSIINGIVSNGTEGELIMIFILGWNADLMVSGGLAGPTFLWWTLQLAKFQAQSPLTVLRPIKILFLSDYPHHPNPLSLPFWHKIRPTHTLILPRMFLSHPNNSASTIDSLVGSDKTDVEPTLIHMESTCTNDAGPLRKFSTILGFLMNSWIRSNV